MGKFRRDHSVGQLLLLRACAAPIVLLLMVGGNARRSCSLSGCGCSCSGQRLHPRSRGFLGHCLFAACRRRHYYLACPIFVNALSAIVLRERASATALERGLIGFGGVLITAPSSQTVSWPAMIASWRQPVWVLMLDHPSLGQRPISCWRRRNLLAPFALGADVAVRLGCAEPGQSVLFAVAGCISVAALLCVNRSLKLAPASVVVPYQYSMIIWAVMFGYVVFGDVPEVATIIGAAIIIGAGIYIFMRERALGREETVVNPPV